MDQSEQTMQKLRQTSSLQDLCAHWKSEYRGIAVALQSIAKIFYPHGAQFLETLIPLLDTFCTASTPPSP